MTLSDYISLFPGATRGKPKFMALAEAVLRQAADLVPLTEALQSAFSFVYAEGQQLDDLAKAVGLSRHDAGPEMQDEDFRQYLLAKLALWTWNGTNESIPDVLHAVLTGSRQADHGDGTVTLYPGEPLPVPAKELFPVPAGVRAAVE